MVTKKFYKFLSNIPADNIIELYKLIYAEAKLVRDKIDVPLRNPNGNTKPRWEIKFEGQVKKLQQ